MSQAVTNPRNLEERPQLLSMVESLASQCVKCGLCLSYCPTYQLTKNENESPRGRIELLKAISQDQLTLTPKVTQHLDQCLSCRACETVCPAKVSYGKLITRGRAMMKSLDEDYASPNATHRFFQYLVSHPKQLNRLHWLLWLLEISKIRKIGTFFRIPELLGLSAFNRFLPKVARPKQQQNHYAAIGPKKGTVGLFLGCFQRLTDVALYEDTISLLTQIGYDVIIPRQQTCCGAIALHQGDAHHAAPLMQKNVMAFTSQDMAELDHVVSLASGCGSVLQEYPQYNDTDIPLESSYRSFANKIVDISTMLLNTTWPANLKIKNFEKKIMLHSPCTHKHGMRCANDPFQLIKQIPKAKVSLFSHQNCCGAAGTYMIDFPELSSELSRSLVHELEEKKPDILVTSNIGCALNFKQLIQEKKRNIEVIHPVTLLSKLIFF